MVMLLVLLLPSAHADMPCPDYVDAIARAEQALPSKDLDEIQEALYTAEQGLRCGPVAEDGRVRARYWLAQAVLLDLAGDRFSSERALFAAWRANPDASITRLPSHLQVRYTEVIERPTEEATFSLAPLPQTGSVIWIDGAAVSSITASTNADVEEVIRTMAGLHIVQLTRDAVAPTVMAGRVVDLPSDRRNVLNIFDTSMFGRQRADLQIGDIKRSGPQGGCAHTSER